MPEDKPAEPTAALADIDGNDELSHFIAVVSHELRTPLGAFLTAIELLGETELSPRQRDYVATLKEAAESGLVLTDLLLALRRDGAEQDFSDRTSFVPGDIVRSVAALLSPPAERRGLRVSVRIAPGAERPVVGPATSLRQAVTALLDNALKYTVTGEVAVDAEIATGAAPVLRVAVRDNGPGIGESERERIFQAFERGAGTAAVTSGHGLGLWITRQIADRAGGSLCLDPSTEGGARFVVELPVRPDDAAEHDAMPARDTTDIDDRLGGRRVLVVDDSAIGRRLIAACLEGFGASYVLASSGQQALAALNEGEFDAVLLDIHMPDMSGLDVARRIAESDRAESLPVIGLSADTAAADRDPAGFADIVAKPFQPAALYRALADAIAEPGT